MLSALCGGVRCYALSPWATTVVIGWVREREREGGTGDGGKTLAPLKVAQAPAKWLLLLLQRTSTRWPPSACCHGTHADRPWPTSPSVRIRGIAPRASPASLLAPRGLAVCPQEAGQKKKKIRLPLCHALRGSINRALRCRCYCFCLVSWRRRIRFGLMAVYVGEGIVINVSVAVPILLSLSLSPWRLNFDLLGHHRWR
jgi:hypothetical protein